MGLLGWDRLFRDKYWLQLLYHLDHRITTDTVYLMYLDLSYVYKIWTRNCTQQCVNLVHGACMLLLLYTVIAVKRWQDNTVCVRAYWILSYKVWDHVYRSASNWRFCTLWRARLLCMKGMMLLDLGFVFAFKYMTAKSWLHHLWKQGRQNDHSAPHSLIIWIVFDYERHVWDTGFLLHMRLAGNWLILITCWLGKNYDLWTIKLLIMVCGCCHRFTWYQASYLRLILFEWLWLCYSDGSKCGCSCCPPIFDCRVWCVWNWFPRMAWVVWSWVYSIGRRSWGVFAKFHFGEGPMQLGLSLYAVYTLRMAQFWIQACCLQWLMYKLKVLSKSMKARSSMQIKRFPDGWYLILKAHNMLKSFSRAGVLLGKFSKVAKAHQSAWVRYVVRWASTMIQHGPRCVNLYYGVQVNFAMGWSIRSSWKALLQVNLIKNASLFLWRLITDIITKKAGLDMWGWGHHHKGDIKRRKCYTGSRCINPVFAQKSSGYKNYIGNVVARCTMLMLFICNGTLGYSTKCVFRTRRAPRMGCLVSYFWSPKLVLGDVVRGYAP
ncbi:hypothetical protein HanPSC8_Chr14g0632901 [Helianthus annuus]|nr:hypothetical protein HanPSC8_Chr14g0632901 [Helianthus annuus]